VFTSVLRTIVSSHLSSIEINGRFLPSIKCSSLCCKTMRIHSRYYTVSFSKSVFSVYTLHRNLSPQRSSSKLPTNLRSISDAFCCVFHRRAQTSAHILICELDMYIPDKACQLWRKFSPSTITSPVGKYTKKVCIISLSRIKISHTISAVRLKKLLNSLRRVSSNRQTHGYNVVE